MATRSNASGETGFCISRRESRDLRRWLLLARLSASWQRAFIALGLLEAEACAKCSTRSRRDARFAHVRVDGLTHLGMHSGTLASRAHGGAHRACLGKSAVA